MQDYPVQPSLTWPEVKDKHKKLIIHLSKIKEGDEDIWSKTEKKINFIKIKFS